MSTSPPIVPALSQGGTVTGNLSVTGSVSAGSSPGGPLLELVASTGAAGFALQNATPNILTWTAPSDGNLHRFMIFSILNVTTAETGGAIQYTWTSPGAGTIASNPYPGGTATTGPALSAADRTNIVAAGATVTLKQLSALTAGAATLYAEIWAS